MAVLAMLATCGFFAFADQTPATSVLACTAKAQDTDKAKKDVAALQGSWEIVGMESGGKQAGASVFEGIKLVVQGSEATLHDYGRVEEATFTLDPAKNPKWVDVTFKDKSVRKGLYVLDGDTLKISIRLSKGLDRPKELVPAPEDREGALFTLQRIKS